MAKRSHGEGSVNQLANGTWRGQVMDGYTDEGKRKRISFTGPTKKDVLAQIREYQAQKDANVHIDKGMTLQDWSEAWYAGYEDQVEDSTYCNYRYTLNIIQAKLGDMKLAEVLPLQIEGFLQGLRRKYSESQVTKCRSMLIQIYDAADANGLVVRNPARKAKPPKKQKRAFGAPLACKNIKDAFTDSEVETILRKHPENMIGNSTCLMIGTGLRVQEVIALAKADIPPNGSSITVNKAVKTVNGKSTLGPPKSECGERVIPVPEDYRKYAVYIREHGGEPFLWSMSKLHPLYSVSAFRRRYYKMINALNGVRHLSPHCCRHTYITRLQARGVPMETIARLAGHSKIETTNGYLHTSDEVLERAAAVLNQPVVAPSTTDTVA